MKHTPSDDSLATAAREWVVKLSSGEMSEVNFTELKAWRSMSPEHDRAFTEARRAWRNIKSFEGSFVHHERAARFAMPPLWRKLVPAGALLATLIIALVFTDTLTRLRADYSTARGEITQITLPDGSQAVLNTNTALDVDYVGNERKITLLQGEAWFQVQHDASRPFIVHAQKGQVRAVGTAFSVRADDDRVTVVVTEGTVTVSKPEDVHQRATVNEQIVYGSTGAIEAATRVDAAANLSWRDHRVVIVNRPLQEAVAELRRYQQGAVMVLGEAANQRVTGVFTLGSIDDGLQGIAAARNLHVLRLTPLLTILY